MYKHFIMGFVVLVILPSCGGSSGYGSGSTSPLSTSTVQEVDCSTVMPTGTVNIQPFTFSPAIETIGVGGTVKWINNDSNTHTVTAGMPGAPSMMFNVSMAPAATKCLTFTAAGNFSYYSSMHNMTGQVIVQ